MKDETTLVFIGAYVPETLQRQLKEIATKEKRNVSQQLNLIIEKFVKEYNNGARKI